LVTLWLIVNVNHHCITFQLRNVERPLLSAPPSSLPSSGCLLCPRQHLVMIQPGSLSNVPNSKPAMHAPHLRRRFASSAGERGPLGRCDRVSPLGLAVKRGGSPTQERESWRAIKWAATSCILFVRPLPVYLRCPPLIPFGFHSARSSLEAEHTAALCSLGKLLLARPSGVATSARFVELWRTVPSRNIVHPLT
jgi:hypothetical protein